MAMGLTAKQTETYNYIRKYMMEKGIAPTLDEIRDALDLKSKSGVHRLLQGLHEWGWIRRMGGRSRAIELCQEPVTSTVDLTSPILRQALIAAGWTPPQSEREAA